MREYRGKKKIIYENGKKIRCDYNRYNENFLIACYDRYVELISNYKNVLPELWESILTIIGIILLIISTFIPILIPFLVYNDKKRILKEHGIKQLESWRN